MLLRNISFEGLSNKNWRVHCFIHWLESLIYPFGDVVWERGNEDKFQMEAPYLLLIFEIHKVRTYEYPYMATSENLKMVRVNFDNHYCRESLWNRKVKSKLEIYELDLQV